jgi:PAS domain S-box-containing protein
MEKEQSDQPRNTVANPASGDMSFLPEAQDEANPGSDGVMISSSPPLSSCSTKGSRRQNEVKLGAKIGPWHGRGQFILVVSSFFSTLLLILVLSGYRTSWGRNTFPANTIEAVAGLSIVLGGLLVLLMWRYQRHRSAVQALEANLRDLGRASEEEEILRKLIPFPSRGEMLSAARGWNRLVAAVDELREQNLMKQTGENLGQFLCSYDSQKLLGILDSLTDGIILTDAQGSILLANRSCEGKLGRSLSEFIGQSVLDLFNDAQAKEILGEILSGQSLQTDEYFEVVLTPSKGGTFRKEQGLRSTGPQEGQTESTLEELLQAEAAVLWVCCHRLTSDRDNSDILLTLRDITQQKVSEASRDAFVAHVSHELRSPLTNIRAYAETLLSDIELDARAQKESFNVINEETSRMIRLVNDILDLSHMETGSFRLDKGEVVLDRLVRQSVCDVRASASSKKITLQTNYHPKLPNLHLDREKLVVVINNILSNAIKYTPESGTVFVETNVDDRYVYIKITDTGIGITAKDTDRIFEKFYRVDREETAEITGSGLGLAICKEIVQMHGGMINVTSELNKGTEMEIKLPLTQTGPVLGPALEENV